MYRTFSRHIVQGSPSAATPASRLRLLSSNSNQLRLQPLALILNHLPLPMTTPNTTRLLRWTPFAGSVLRWLSFSLPPLAFGLCLTASAQQVAPLQFSETPAASSFFTASVTNAFDGIGSALADDWTLEAETGDRLTVRIEAAIGNSSPRLRVLNPSGQTIVSVDGSTSGIAESYNTLLSSPGTYRVRVYSDTQVSNYRLRVDLSRGPTLEIEPNNTTNQANFPNSEVVAGSYRYRVGATLPADDSAGGFYKLGAPGAGNAIAADIYTGPSSTLQPGNAVFALFQDGQSIPILTTNQSFSFVVPAHGLYFAQVSSATNRDLFARYFLTLTVTDSIAPSVLAVTLPPEGATSTNIINSFDVTFSEPMAPASANNLANYSLRNAGPDTVFNTADDQVYPLLSPAYVTGTTATFALADGPLQPGNYRLTISSLVTDRAGNPLTPAFTRNFTIERLGLFQFENRTNDSPALATSLSLNPLNTPDGSFQALATYPVGSIPYFIFSGRFNADTNVDLAVANYSSGTVSILLGNGDNTFQPATNFPTGSGPIALATGDLNGDGLADLVVANYGGSSVSVLLGNGDGTFTAPTNYSVGGSPRSVVLGDLNNDGKLDLVTANSGSGNITVRLGNGDGTFQDAVNIATGSSPYGVALGQLNGDGFLDIVVANAGTSALSLLLGNGDGTFAAPISLPVGNGPRSVVIRDLNGDGKADLASVNGNDNTVSVLFGNGDGTFAAAVGYPTGSSDPYQIIAADVDADGHPDLVVANYSGSRLGILLNNGAGGFYSPVNYSVGNNPISVVAADLNGDGHLELATANYGGNNVTVLTPNPTQLLAEDPPGRGIRTGAGRGNLSTTSDVDYWSFSGRAGDRLVVASETPGNPGGSGLYYRVERPDGGVVSDFYGTAGGANGTGQLPPVTLPVSGTYVVRVSAYYTYSGEYRIRVTTAPPIWQLESEDNNSVSQANTPAFTLEGNRQRARILGYIRVTDPGDVFQLGNLSPGTSIGLSYAQPGSSGLTGILEVLNSAGTVVASESAGTTNLTYSVPAAQAGQYYARIRAQSGTEGLFSQYLLSIDLFDTVPPTITGDTLPPEGSSLGSLFSALSLNFSEDMLPPSVNNPNSYDLRSAGPDGLFDTVDDVLQPITLQSAYSSGLTANYAVAAGALQPGAYRFTARTNLQDRAGNAMAAAYVRQFTIAQVAGLSTEIEPNNTSATATALPITGTQPNLFSGGGRGYLANSGDVDYWSFNAQAGDVFVLAAQIPGNPGNSGLQYIIYSPSGTQLFSQTSANNGLLQTDPLVLTDTGTFTVRVSQYYGYYSEYRIRASLYRGGLDVEREPNDSIASANTLTFTTNATNSTASVVGTILVSNDLDYFNLGTIQAGKTVFLKTRQPGSSPLISVVSVYNAANTYMPEAGSGRPSDGVAEVQIAQTGTYYAAVRATADSGGLMSEYILDVLVVPTTAVSFPNLQVTQLTIPVTTGLKSGDPFTFAYTVANVGSLATQVGTWFDRVVLSTDSVMDDADLQLGLYQHNGVLQPGQSYSLTNTVNLPDGIAGPWYVIAKTDFTDNVNEFILEGDNETATDTPLNIALAKYPDLVRSEE